MEMKDSYERLKSERYNIDTWIDAVLSGNPKAELAFNAGAHPILSLCTGGSCVRVKHLHLERITTFFPRLRRGLGNLLHLRIFLHPRCRLAFTFAS